MTTTPLPADDVLTIDDVVAVDTTSQAARQPLLPADHNIVTVEQTAAALGCGPKAVRRLIRLKRLKAQVIDRRGTVRIHRSEITRFLLGGKAA